MGHKDNGNILMSVHLCRVGHPEALLWRQPASSAAPSEPFTPTVLSHNRPDSEKTCMVECMDWNTSGTLLATGSMDGLIRLWESSGDLTPVNQCLHVQKEDYWGSMWARGGGHTAKTQLQLQ